MDDDTAEILRRKVAFIEQRKRSLGPEYYQSKEFWDRMWEQEWFNLEERKTMPLEETVDLVPVQLPTITWKEYTLTIYTYSDFIMLHNQGIFREKLFIIDHTGKWRKNVIQELLDFGYTFRENYQRNMLIMEEST